MTELLRARQALMVENLLPRHQLQIALRLASLVAVALGAIGWVGHG